MELDKNIEQELAGLLADPEKVSVQHIAMLHDLLQQYPYYQPLHLLLAKASQDAEQNNALARASLYTNGQRLHRFLFEKREVKTHFQLNEVPAEIGAELPVVTDEQETFEEISEPASFASYEPVAVSPPAAADEGSVIEETDPAIAEEEVISESENPAAANDNSAVEETDPAIAEAGVISESENPAATDNNSAVEEADPAIAEEEDSSDEEHTASEFLTEENPAEEEQPPVTDEQETFEEISEPVTFAPTEIIPSATEEEVVAADEPPVTDEQETFEEISETPTFQTIPPPTEQDIPAEESYAEDNVFEEIGEVNYDEYRPFRNNVQAVPQQIENVEEEYREPGETEQVQAEEAGEIEPEQSENAENEQIDIESVPSAANEAENAESGQAVHTDTADTETGEARQPEQTASPVPEAQKNALEDDFVFESIVSTDFFAFENNFSTVEEVQPEKPEVAAPPVIEEHNEAAADEVANSTVSNYNDDKLPYTFLWWLAKTRKEHQSSFQPYVAVKKPGSQELQQQYVEHIFHLQSHLTGTDELIDSAEPPKPVSKDFQIIDSFIKNDPQIHPPNAEQIDNENKAKKSAEDQNDLVSETLAGIYIEQMLYDKAIDTYEKLSLKFPEKSRYFADLIQSIEKKI